MAIIPRRVLGPQQQFERSGAQSLRDIRPFTVRLSEAARSSASGLVLATMAAGTYLEPALVDLTVPLSIAYATWVLTRRAVLPIRLPISAATLDVSNPEPGTRKAQPSDGSWFVGWNLQHQEVWLTSKDMRQHVVIPGTTGSGKTTTILSLLVNPLAQGSGFVLVDGKADRDLFGKVLALARRFGREDDVRVLKFMVASGLKDSHTFNAFASGNADAIRELLASLLGESSQTDSNGVFRERAVALIGTIVPALVWLRDHKGIPLTIDIIRFSIELRWIWKLAMERTFLVRDTDTGEVTEIVVKDEIPEDIVWPLKSYLGELPGYDATIPLDKQQGDEPRKQHGYAQFYFTGMFTQLTVSLGHIFRCEMGDIDMRDVVLNRRILVVNLPALENSDATLAALGKLVVASLRGMMAQMLGVSLEGEYVEADKPGMGPSPFPVVLDEVGYYAASGMDRMLAMGRGLNMTFILAFQEIAGIRARIGDKAFSLLGNGNLTIAMRQQEGGQTREWLEKIAGQTFVTQATQYHGAADGNYREARSAELRAVSRLDWNDLTSMIEGEAIVMFGGRLIHAHLFHAKIDDSGPKRLGRTIKLRSPDATALRARVDRVDRIARTIASAGLIAAEDVPTSTALEALVKGFIKAAETTGVARDCARAAIQAVAELPEDAFDDRPGPPADGSPVTAVTPMLRAANQAVFAGPGPLGSPSEPVDVGLRRGIEAIERAAGADAASVNGAALSILAERDEAIAATVVVDPPRMPVEVFAQHLDAAIRQIEALRGGAERRAA